MTDKANPLGHLPDPDKRYQVLAFNRENLVYIEIADQETRQGLVVDFVSAMEIASDINAELARMYRLWFKEDVEAGKITPADAEALLEDEERWGRQLWQRQSEN